MVNYAQFQQNPFGGFEKGMQALRQDRNFFEQKRQADIQNAFAGRQMNLAERREGRLVQQDAQTEQANQIKLFGTQLDFVGRALNTVKDEQSHMNFKNLIGKMSQAGMFKNLKDAGFDIDSMIPANYDQQKVEEGKALINSLLQKTEGGGTDDIKEYQYALKGGFQGSFTDWMNKGKSKKAIERTVDLGDKVEYVYTDGTRETKPKGASPSTVIMGDRRRVTDEMALRKEFLGLPETKDYVLINSQMQRLDKAMEENTKGGSKVAVDQALITILNKMLDPSSVVRESEYARTPGDLALISRLRGKIEKLKTGGAGLTDQDREGIARMARNFYQVSENMYNQQLESYADLAKRYGYAPENILRLGGTKGGETYKKQPKTAGSYLQKFED